MGVVGEGFGSKGIWVLRLGHRLVRDERTSTHVGLVARAFGADGIYLVDTEREVAESIRGVVERWGGEFQVREVEDWRALVKEWRRGGGQVIHLTMYGLHIDDALDEIKRGSGDMLIVVGAEKVPRELFELADYNVAIGHQPHSEVAALALFLDRLFGGEELRRSFAKARLKVVPSRKGKKIIRVNSSKKFKNKFNNYQKI